MHLSILEGGVTLASPDGQQGVVRQLVSRHLLNMILSVMPEETVGDEDFYKRLAPLHSFSEVFRFEDYVPLPGDWLILMSDVVDSTRAIEEGRYKEVNLLGASTIIGLLNVLSRLEIPYVFGGDGATLAIPPTCRAQAKEALLGVRQMARDAFGLKMRVGIVEVAELRRSGTDLRLGKVSLSPNLKQAVFTGGGLKKAEEWIKTPGNPCCLPEEEPQEPGDFSGLECRWQSVKSTRGKFLSLLVTATGPDAESHAMTYEEVLKEIGKIFAVQGDSNPLEANQLKLSLNPKNMKGDWAIRGVGEGSLKLGLRKIYTWVHTLVGKVVMGLGLRVAGVDWGRYRETLVENTDFQKFDEMIRMVVAGSEAQEEKLRSFLSQQREKGKLAYGIHSSPDALLTCLILDRAGSHVHFVDGSGGGYAMAARELKRQIAESPIP